MKKNVLPKLLRQIRLDSGLTQLQLAHILHQTQSYVSKYEAGEQRLDLYELHQICNAVGTPLNVLVEKYLAS
jgi:transcriptional regulator with XRE-family HTH domain